MRAGNNLGHGVEGPADVKNALWIAWDALGDHDAGAALLTNFIHVRTALSNDDGGVLSDDKAAHVYIGRGGRSRCGRRGLAGGGCCILGVGAVTRWALGGLVVAVVPL